MQYFIPLQIKGESHDIFRFLFANNFYMPNDFVLN
jgi:hypothetical protein